MNPENEPMRFVDRLSTGRHVVLFYDNPQYALKIQFEFIKNGLLRGEHCVYTSHGDTRNVENQMTEYGIDVKGFRRKNLLHLYTISNPMDDVDGTLKGALKTWRRILADSKPPYRAVTRAIPELNTVEGIEAQLSLERYSHPRFRDLFQGSMLCPYYFEEIEASRRSEWTVELLQNHHDAIFAPKDGAGIAFNMR